MNRVLLFVVVIVIFIGSVLSGYFYMRSINRDVNISLNAVPTQAAFVFESNNFLKDWKNESLNSLLFSELRSFETFATYDSVFTQLDSALEQDLNLKTFFADLTITISLHKSGAKNVDLLFTFSIPPTQNEDAFVTKLEAYFSNGYNKKEKQYDQAKLVSFESNGNSIFYTFYKDVIVISLNQMLVEDAIRQLNSGKSLLDKPSFNKVYKTKGNGNNGNLLINPETMQTIAATVFNGSTQKFETPFSGWMAYDLMLKPNSLFLSGFCQVSDSTTLFLNRFKGQSSQDFSVAEILPSNTCFVLHYGVSDFNSYYKNYLSELSSSNQIFDYEKNIKSKREIYGESAINALINFTQNEFGLFITQPVLSDVERNSFAFFRSSNLSQSEKELSAVSFRVDSINFNDDKKIIYQCQVNSLLPDLFGDGFGIIEGNYYMTFSNYLIFSNTISSLKELVNQNIAENTLTNKNGFKAFSEHLSSETNYMVYCNVSKSNQLFESVLKRPSFRFLKKNFESIKNFENVTFQVSSGSNNLFYSNIFLNHNPDYKQETGSLWELELDTQIVSKPFVFINHYTKSREIFVQDANNKTYLVSNTGKVLWESQLNNRIVDKIYMVDVYKNNKYQLLFNTSNAVYLIDRNGKNVDNYPIIIKEGIAGSVHLLDYDKNREYRVLIPTKDGKLQNRTIGGSIVKGWNYKSKNTSNVAKLDFFKIKSKDYISVIYNNGLIEFLNRKGEARLKLKETLPEGSVERVFLQKSNSLENTLFITSDSLGNIVNISCSDKKTITTTDHVIRSEHTYYPITLEGGAKYHLFADVNTCLLYDDQIGLLFEKEFDNDYLLSPQVYVDKNGIIKIVLTLQKEKRVFLINHFGISVEEYPIKGSTSVLIGDLNNDGSYNMVVGSGNKKLMMYSLN